MSPTFSGCLASVDGAITPAETATIPVLDEGLIRGDGVFEVMRLYHGRPFAVDEHLARLERSARNLRLPLDLEAVRAEMYRLLAEAGSGPAHGKRGAARSAGRKARCRDRESRGPLEGNRRGGRRPRWGLGRRHAGTGRA